MPSRSAASFVGGAAVLRPRPRGASGRVSRAVISWSAARRSRTSAPNGAVAATASFISAKDEPRPQRRHRLAPRLGRRAVDHELAVEMVELVLRDPRRHPLEVVADLVALLVDSLEADSGGTLDRNGDALDRQAALVVEVRLLAAFRQLWIDEDEHALVVRREHEHASQHADLRRCEPD